MRKTSLDCVHALAKDDQRIVFMGSDLGVGTLKGFKADMPERFFMEGICEQSILGMAAGLALEGRIVYVNTIATFLARRAFEQIVLDLCLHDVKVRLIANGGGMVYAPLGPTHMAVEDLSALRSIPNLTILAPADAVEMARLMPLTVDHPGPVYIRLGKGYDPVVTEGHPLPVIGQAVLARQGDDVLFVTTGVTLQQALLAADELSGQGVSATILHLHTVKPFDAAAVLREAARVRAVVSIEENTILGGLGGAVAEVLAEAGLPNHPRLKRLGIPDVFPDQYGSQAGLMARYGMDASAIATQTLALLGKGA
ncbi:MAG: transketolase C-terminal domain-containing protein [Humidesulfovibrio sp.]|uniref:transketolase family protein n=1 Tax=Humidesulfovibrio sp. TaxID=2910988 RepID=UPI0027EAFE4B|nr:transketolase C-terminal domain-containing protein [Humidesulfovibrio sp.]MDQ7834821.1 transketolase C-terminal domain-containing protein [Humidesulfovibrio sp.]